MEDPPEGGVGSSLVFDGDVVLWPADAEQADQNNDEEKESDACVDGAETQAATRFCLGQQVPERGAKRPREDIGEPEGQNGIRAEEPGEADQRDQAAEHQDAPLEAKAKRLGRAV